ncbi:hypothetical protein SEA_CUMBERBATCH_24 [Streptomyces phage Cumberbatch]|uniref:Uncharacterized protein n=1 Tax=Streptomyces phage Cumberbatch TaxID=2736271 RepID=A0A6M9Z4K1_9CAUD|nr:hypothetical protein QEN65_gp24 [Streptomyces phage Cumberbatch]QKN87666.1 hypothetical protein SEA_CUMBERBATCH_24 [Streptomyces phage Cumberbatch]
MRPGSAVVALVRVPDSALQLHAASESRDATRRKGPAPYSGSDELDREGQGHA